MGLVTWQATVQDDETGQVVPSPVVTVRNADDDTLATIYDMLGASTANPITGDLNGFVQFQVNEGYYKIEGAKDGDVAEDWFIGQPKPIPYDGSAAELIADTVLDYNNTKAGRTIVTDEGYRYEVAASGASDSHVTTAGGLKLYVQPLLNGRMSPTAWGAIEASTKAAAAVTTECTAILQAINDAGYEIQLKGWVHINDQLLLNNKGIFGLDQRNTGVWCSTSASGVTIYGTGAQIRSAAVEGNHTPRILVQVGNGVQGNQSFDLELFDVRVFGAAERSVLVRENSNAYAYFCIFSGAGDRDTAVIDESRHTLEVRSIFRCFGCNVSSATGFPILVTGSTDVEECRLEYIGGRVQTGFEGLVKVVGYDHNYLTNAIFEGTYFENPGLVEGGVTGSNSVESVFVAQGKGALIEVNGFQKIFGREASFVAQGLDSGRVYINGNGPVIFQDLNATLDQGGLANTGTVTATAYAPGIYISDPGVLIDSGGTIYSRKFEECPYTTAGAFDAADYNVVSSQTEGRVHFGQIPSIRSSAGTDDFDLTDWQWFVQAPATDGSNSVDFDMVLKEVISDGTDTAVISATSAVTSALSTTAGEFLTSGSSLQLTGTGAATPASFQVTLTVTEDMVGYFFKITTKWAYKQVGGTFGGSGTMTNRIRVSDGTGTARPTSGENEAKIFSAPGAGNLTNWQSSEHVFYAESEGTLTYTHFLNGAAVALDDIMLVDNIKLWAIRSENGIWS